MKTAKKVLIIMGKVLIWTLLIFVFIFGLIFGAALDFNSKD